MGHYVIRVEGSLSAGLTSAFPSLVADQHAETVVYGLLEDQSALAGVLDRLRCLGVDVVEVLRLPDLAALSEPAASPPPGVSPRT
jgi:hypothetical protein